LDHLTSFYQGNHFFTHVTDVRFTTLWLVSPCSLTQFDERLPDLDLLNKKMRMEKSSCNIFSQMVAYMTMVSYHGRKLKDYLKQSQTNSHQQYLKKPPVLPSAARPMLPVGPVISN